MMGRDRGRHPASSSASLFVSTLRTGAAGSCSRRRSWGDRHRWELTTQVLAEFCHVVTDERRFEHPMGMAEAVDLCEQWVAGRRSATGDRRRRRRRPLRVVDAPVQTRAETTARHDARGDVSPGRVSPHRERRTMAASSRRSACSNRRCCESQGLSGEVARSLRSGPSFACSAGSAGETKAPSRGLDSPIGSSP